jgi:hypothetical protein
MVHRYYIICDDKIEFAGDNEILAKKLLQNLKTKNRQAILLSLNKGLIGSTTKKAWKILGDMEKELLRCSVSASNVAGSLNQRGQETGGARNV